MISDMANTIFGGNDQENAVEEEYKDPREEGISLIERLLRMRESKKKLNSIMQDEVKGSTGQGLFIKNVLQNYFSNDKEKVPVMDQRAMLASALRNVKPMQKLPEDATDKQKEDAQKAAMGHFMSGFLKGAGPLLQKMLQGMPEGAMPEELRDVLKDMKSNLAPIPDRIVRAHLKNMIDRSNKRITKIEVTRALGAASVGQAFLCKMYGPGMPEDGQDVVVKLLRPNVRNRMLREKKIMLQCAKLTDIMMSQKEGNKENNTDIMGGMEATYRGQLARIEEELDLTIEARNVQKGTVYDEGFTTVQAMKVNNVVEPTANSLVIERAPGTTVDKYLEETSEKQKAILKPFYVLNDKGEIQKEADGKADQLKLTGANIHQFASSREQLTQMLEQMQKRQKYLLQLTDLWVREGVYGSGFYHGDLHAGNIMVDDSGLTVIDFGNVTKLSPEQQKAVTRLMMAATVRDVEVFRHCFHELLENTPEDKYQEKRAALTKVFEDVLRLGDASSIGQRIAAALMKAQSLGIELPPAVHNFSQCQIRLQNTVDYMNFRIFDVQKAIERIDRLKIEDNQAKDVYQAMHNEICITTQDELQKTLSNHQTPDETLIANAYQKKKQIFIYDTKDKVLEKLRKTEKKDRESFDKYFADEKDILKRVSDLENYFVNLKTEIDPSIYEQIRQSMVDPMKVFWKNVWNGVVPLDKREQALAIGKELEECVLHIFDEGTEQRLQVLFEQIKDMGKYREYAATMQRIKTIRDAQDDPKTDPKELEKMENALCEEVEQREYKAVLNQFEFANFRDALQSDSQDVRAAMDVNMQNWFADTANLGAELKEAYEAYRAAEAEHAQDTEQKLDALMNVYHRAVISRMSQMENLFRSKEVNMKEPDDFLDAMGGVISENVKSSLSRIGRIRGIKYQKKMDKEKKEEEKLKKQQETERISEEQLDALEIMREAMKQKVKQQSKQQPKQQSKQN